MDIEQALEEWNTVQATLRQVSAKVSDALLLLGLVCLGSIALLAEQVIREPEKITASATSIMMWFMRFYPLILASWPLI